MVWLKQYQWWNCKNAYFFFTGFKNPHSNFIFLREKQHYGLKIPQNILDTKKITTEVFHDMVSRSFLFYLKNKVWQEANKVADLHMHFCSFTVDIMLPIEAGAIFLFKFRRSYHEVCYILTTNYKEFVFIHEYLFWSPLQSIYNTSVINIC